ncbi:hypothetical protein OF117_15280 [Geodermatophilus sp. YIM 151500]|uniref:sugar-transfer associated ATP-grasp domain-containing protein n=1 Tax=Geodermatophilus sp. YIM 151500 TaxID=2984531 RepID=UPI0021E41DDC|nr:sugar-transfer associated ATP-grasp domain-containing protein [Geodermatophilus sp. YIM 151500]MCV2490721.1 hypothetical protein [Geodermatophilus sp. YIM 151500]
MLRAAARWVRDAERVAGRLLRLERSDYAGALHPAMWRRGFLSNRRYAYPGIEDRSLPYISDLAFHTRARALNTPAAQVLVQHKHVFADALAARGLAACAPEVYATIGPGGLRVRSPGHGDRLRAQDLVVVKPTSGYGGGGVRLVTPAEAEATVADPRCDLIVQERVLQHPELRAVNPGSLNTLRVLAVRLPGHGPLLAAAVQRWGRVGTGPVDNLSAGGLCSAVDLDTGRLGPAVGRPRDRRRVEHDTHPDSGARIAGVLVPQWPQVRDLAFRLMAAFPELDHVGWDIAVTDRGPLVIEGNGSMPGVNVFQFHGPFLTDPRLLEYYVGKGMLRRPESPVTPPG